MPFTNKMSEFDDIIGEIGNVTSLCSSLIGEEQLSQIEALKAEVESLKSQLLDKDNEIQALKKGQSKKMVVIQREVEHVDKTIQEIIQELTNDLPDNSTEQLKLLKQLSKEKNRSNKMSGIVDYMKQFYSIQQDTENINLLSSMLKDNLNFLNCLASNKELQSLFLYKNETSETLPEEFLSNMLEQAQKTQNFLEQIGTEELKTPLGSISDQLDVFHGNNSRRMEKISAFINEEDISYHDLQDLLYQEITITGSLRQFCETLKGKLVNEKQKSNQMSKLINSQCLVQEESQRTYQLLAQVLNDTITPYSPHALCEMAGQLAQQTLEIQEKLQVHNSDLIIEITNNHKQLKTAVHQCEKQKKLANNQAKLIPQFQKSVSEYHEWIQSLYRAISDPQERLPSEKEMKLAIQEAALTSVGLHEALQLGHHPNYKHSTRSKTEKLHKAVNLAASLNKVRPKAFINE